MKLLLVMFLILGVFVAYSQQNELHMQGQTVDSDNKPVSDVYVINLRTNSQYVSRQNGVFDVWLLPSDTLLITHVTFLRKIISAFDLMKNPVIELIPDTVALNQVNVYSSKKTEYQRAMENIQRIDYDPKPRVTDGFSEAERMQQLLQTHNKVERAAATSLTYGFSPSAVIGKAVDKIKLRRKSNHYNSTKKKKQEP